MECDGTMKENKQKCQKINMPVDKKKIEDIGTKKPIRHK